VSKCSIPSSWITTSLGNVIDYGKTIKAEPSTVKNEMWVLELEDIEKNTSKILKKLTFLDRQSKSSKNRFKAGDVLYGKLRPYLNKVVMSDADGVCSTEIVPLKSPDELNNKYLFYWIKHPEFIEYVTKVGYGVNMPRLGTKDGKAAPFVLSPLAEQKQIADKLDTLLAQVERTKTRLDAIPKILKRFRQSVLAAAVSGKLTEDWREGSEKLNCNIVDDLEKQLNSSEFKMKSKVTGEVSVHPSHKSWLMMRFGRIFNVKSGDGLTSKEMVFDGGVPVYGGNGINGYHDKFNIKKETLVIGRVGYYCGSIHLTEKKSWVTDNALIVSYPEDVVEKKFAYILLKATNLRINSSSTAQPVISGAKIYPIQIPLPPKEEQTEIVRRVEELFGFSDRIEVRVKKAQGHVNHLTQSILAKAFRGELTADWRKQNPDLISGENSAQSLLDKIKIEREKLKPVKKKRTAKKKKTG